MSPAGIKKLLILIYTAGLIGLSLPDLRSYFLPLTPYTLWFTGIVCLYYYPIKNIKTYSAFAIFFIAAWLVEVVGVATGKLFGVYQYGSVLGFKLANVPLVIGMNWLILLICTNAVVEEWNVGGFFGKAALGAGLMTFLDVFIEPVAMSYDFWNWQFDKVPVQNFAAWWLVSFVFHFAYQQLELPQKSSLYRLIALLQFIFFVGLVIVGN